MIGYKTLLQNAAKKAGMTCEEYQSLVDLYFGEMSEQLREGNDVLIHSSIGKIILRERGGKPVVGGGVSKRHYTPIFKESPSLKKALAQTEKEYIAVLRECGGEKIADHLERKAKSDRYLP